MDEADLLKTLQGLLECDGASRHEVEKLEEQLKNYDDLYNDLKRFIEEAESASAVSRGDLEIMNFMKTQLSEHLVELKKDFQKMYMSLQEMGSKLDSFNGPVSLLENVYKQNQETIARIKEKAKNKQDLLVSQQKEIIENLEKKDASLCEEIAKIETQTELLRDLSDKLDDDFDEKVKINENLTMEIEIVEDKLAEKQYEDEAYLKLLFEKQRDLKAQSDRMEDDIKTAKMSNFTMESEINKIVEGMNQSLKLFNDADFEKSCLKKKIEDLQNGRNLFNDLMENITRNYLDKNDILERQVQLEKRLIQNNQNECLSYEDKNAEIMKNDHLDLQINSNKEKISNFENLLEALNKNCEDCLENINNLQASSKGLNEDHKKLESTIVSLNEDLQGKARELEEISAEEQDITLGFNSKLETLQTESAAEATLEGEVNNIANRREELEQKIQDMTNEIEGIQLKMANLQTDKENCITLANQLDSQIESISLETKKIEFHIQHGEKITQIPPPAEQTTIISEQVATTAEQTPTITKQTTNQVFSGPASTQSPKRTIVIDDSDISSADETATIAKQASTQPHKRKIIVIDSDVSSADETSTISKQTSTIAKQALTISMQTSAISKKKLKTLKQTSTKQTTNQAISNPSPSQPPKRKINLDDSDSSCCGERITYSEFLARRAKLLKKTPTVAKQATKQAFSRPASAQLPKKSTNLDDSDDTCGAERISFSEYMARKKVLELLK